LVLLLKPESQLRTIDADGFQWEGRGERK